MCNERELSRYEMEQIKTAALIKYRKDKQLTSTKVSESGSQPSTSNNSINNKDASND